MKHRPADLARRYRITDGRSFRLKSVDPADTAGYAREDADDLLAAGIKNLSAEQAKLYAQDQHALLLIFQAMDAAGKDSTIRHVMSGVNPQGVQVYSFKQPSSEELDHDFMWRTAQRVPERGRIGIFNRSYYEEVLVVRVRPEYLEGQRIPPQLVTGNIWKERFEDINASERYLTRNGITIRKFFLHVSKAEQKRRFMKRLDEPEKNWKFSAADVRERRLWRDYMNAYEDMVRHTATPYAPWYVVPADHKWFTRLVVAAAIGEALAEMKLAYPKLTASQRKDHAAARAALESGA